MKRIVGIMAAVLGVIVGQAQSGKFTVTGDLSGIKAQAEWVYIAYYVADRQVKDSAFVRQNKYELQGNLPEPVLARLSVKYKTPSTAGSMVPANSKRDYAAIFLQPGAMKVISLDSFANVTVTGSKADEEYRLLQELAKPYNDGLDELYRQIAIARKNNEPALAQSIENKIDSLDASANEQVYGTYVKRNPGSILAMYAFRNWAGYEIDADKVEPVFKSLPVAVQRSVSGKEMQEKINIAKKTGIGQMALDFTQNDTLGKPVSLKSLRGKYLLIDFWASWCGPCRRENPSLVAAYNRYNKKGFQVLSVSLDRPGEKEKWVKAIHADGLQWTHVSDLQFWNNAVAVQYGIQAIPQNLLLDPSGKIIAKNLRGESLVKKLAVIYPD